MKALIFLFTLSGAILSAQNLNYKNLKSFIGNRVFEFEDFYKIKSTKTENHFENLSITYQEVVIDNKTFNIYLFTEGKNISKIEVSNTKEKTQYFTQQAEDLENNSEVKKNYKTIFVSVNNKSNKKKIYFEKINELIDSLKNKKYDLKDFIAEVDCPPLKANLYLNENETHLTIKN